MTTVDDAESITQSEFQKRLGVSPAYLASRSDVKDWLQAQPGVVRVNKRRLAIPANLVDAARVRFAITPRAPRQSKAVVSSSDRITDYHKLSTQELVSLKEQEEALLDGTDHNEKVREARQALADAEAQASAAKNASSRLNRITRALDKRRETLEAEADRVARERALLAQAAVAEDAAADADSAPAKAKRSAKAPKAE